MKAHVNEQKTQETLKHEAEVKASAIDYFEKMMALQNAKPPLDQIPVVQCATNSEYDYKLAMAEHAEEQIDDSKFPPYDPNCGKSYEDWLDMQVANAKSDSALIQRYGVNGDVITEILKRPDDSIWDNNPNDCPFDIDDDDAGMVSSSNLSAAQKQAIAIDQNLVNKNYVERKQEEIMKSQNLGGIQSGLFGAVPQPNPMMQTQIPQIPNMTMNPYYQGNTVQFGARPNTIQIGARTNPYSYGYNSMAQQFEIVDGVQVRKITPFFSVCPGGNPYQGMFSRIYMYPTHPQYEEIKDKYTEEEFKYINSMKTIGKLSRPANVSKEEYEKHLDKMYNPYSKENGIPVETHTQDDTPKIEPTVLKCRIRIINPETKELIKEFVGKEEVEIHDQNWINQQMNEQRIRVANRQTAEYMKAAFYANLARYQQSFKQKFPDLETVSTKDFFSGKSDLDARIYDYLITQPQARQQRWNTINANYDTYNYLRNIGMTYDYRMKTHTTAGEDIIRKCGLKPGDPLYDYYRKETEHHNWMAQNCFNADGTPKHEADYDVKKAAYNLALQYPSNNITPGSPCCAVPEPIRATLPHEVLVELGYAKEALPTSNQCIPKGVI